MKTFKKHLYLLILLFCSITIRAEQYVYDKSIALYEVVETNTEYMVYCHIKQTHSKSIRESTQETLIRLDALDLIGAYIVFKENYAEHIAPQYFQLVVDGIKLKYNGIVKDLRKEYKKIDGKSVLCHICPKNNYKIESATYIRNMDLLSLMKANYKRYRTEKSAMTFYEYKEFDSKHYIQLQEDFHQGHATIPVAVRELQQIEDRFERSIYAEKDGYLDEILEQAKSEKSETEPYNRFCLEEMITSSPLNKKREYYEEWKESMQLARTVWEDALYYCCEEIDAKIGKNNLCFSNVISAFCGAIIPYGIRQAITDEMYRKAVNAYSKSDFKQSVEILKESIDIEGISPSTLNLLGASYRFLNKPKDALPFLILCFRLNPKTQYLVGNIALCYQMIDYPQMEELCNFLLNYAVDDWSKNEITKLMKQ